MLATSACRAPARIGLGVLLALVVAGPARAHVDATPAFLTAGGTGTVSLTGHNDRAIAMTAFEVTAPAGFGVAGAGELDGWEASVDGLTAEWTGGRLAPDAAATFRLVVEARSEPGAAELEIRQRYPDGAVVLTRAALTVVPADEASDGDIWPYVIAGAGLLLALAGVVLARRRRGSAPRA